MIQTRNIRWMVAVGYVLALMFLLAVNLPCETPYSFLDGATFVVVLLLELGFLIILSVLTKSHPGL